MVALAIQSYKSPKDTESSCSHRYKQSFDKASLPLISQLEWLNIEEMIDLETATMVYKLVYRLTPYMQDMFQKLSDCRNRVPRSTETDLEIPRYIKHLMGNEAFRISE